MTLLQQSIRGDDENESSELKMPSMVDVRRTLLSSALAAAAFATTLAAPGGNVAHADEWGKETEAPTLFTGETVMICKKRGPLGACLEQVVRTSDNDNDKALKYFKDPSEAVKIKAEKMIESAQYESEGNALIDKLRKQSAENKEKNDKTVRQRTLLNDQGASFGPFSGEVVILNTDGDGFTLLLNPQAMRLKKAGYIEGRKFVIQPTKQVIDDALNAPDNGDLGSTLKGFLFGKEEEGAAPKEEAPAVYASEVTEDVKEEVVAAKEEAPASDVKEVVVAKEEAPAIDPLEEVVAAKEEAPASAVEEVSAVAAAE